MPDVFNWQLGRPMQYRFPAAYPKRQFAFVFNINRCLACQTCTMACKSTWTFSEGQELMWWNNVETKPYGGYPQGWDVKILTLLEQANPGGQEWDHSARGGPYGRFEGKTIFEAAMDAGAQEEAIGYLPTDAEWTAPNIGEDTAAGPRGRSMDFGAGVDLPTHTPWFFYLQRLCNHCTYPACVSACPRNAIYKRPEDGIVLIDQSRCRGYRKCVEQCPYKKPMYRATTRTSEKCLGCYPRVEGTDPLTEGIPMETRCMAVCPGKIRMQGLVDIDPETGDWKEDRQNPLYYLVKVAKVALPLYPQFGTQPNGYYIPPRWVPREYLHQMFGPGVEEAIDTYLAPPRELLAVLQLFRATQRIVFRYEIREGPKVRDAVINGRRWAMYDDTVIGYDSQGNEVANLSVVEPFVERPAKYLNSI
ncbi:MAG TPA: 4Fe-4S dicluster domain-containing protein [Actinomycetota bacterium]|nr:4Fe-4S dicluster domain-containing protein [Actinomycetota bacterium]